MNVSNMTSSRGNKVPNQFSIMDEDKSYFQSYQTIIAMRDTSGDYCQTYLDSDRWDYSVTTSKYRNKWLGMTTAQIKKAIDAGEIILRDLNK
jgi:hypothetical protein|tara:strand:+ start:135 stop:410 length:276 start_codon:yes stop_codon:yes gene_type:complete